MTEMPTGAVTFLFTDIEGSTLLWERQPEATRLALARHDAMIRQSVEVNQGSIVKTTGDGCLAVFEAAADAVAASLDAQRRLNTDPWAEIQPDRLLVRMAIHTGEAEARAGDYFGPTVNRAARLMAAAHGGQVLVSAPIAELIRDALPSETILLDLGEHRLKDLIRTEHIFQLAHPELKAEFPPLRSLDARPNNLPVQLTSFVGREREIGEVEKLIAAARLITLTGSGGTGKTRLSLQAAAEALPGFVDGVWLAELAPLTDPAVIPSAIAGIFELGAAPGLPPMTLVTDYLRGKKLLLILDNCEHLIEACAQVANDLLRACPGLKILASSREGLGIAGEVTYHVPSLSLPSGEAITPEALATSEAAQLFLARASAANPRFILTPGNTGAVAQICQRLDGIPLALELAASRSKLFSPEQIAARLNDRFRLLTGGSRTALPRQQTLRAMIDWSYDLLSEPERALLRRLAVFSGGWTFEAADMVCADLDVLTLLDQLINKSLVLSEEHGGQTRYHMLETVRQYARDRLVESGEIAELRDRHFEYYLGLSAQADPHLTDDTAFEWIEILSQDRENLRSALDWRQADRPEDALRLAGHVPFFWGFRADDRQFVLEFLGSLLDRVGPPGENSPDLEQARAWSRCTISRCLILMGSGRTQEAVEGFSAALVIERRLGERLWQALCLANLTVVAGFEDDYVTMQARAQEAIEIARTLKQKWARVIPLSTLALLARHEGDKAKARQLDDEVRANLKGINHPIFMPISIGMGTEARLQGRYDDAKAIFGEALRMSQRFGSTNLECSFQSELAHIKRLEGKLDEAELDYRQLIITWAGLGHRGAVANQLEYLAFIARRTGRLERALLLFGAADVLREGAKAPMRDYERSDYDSEVTALRETTPPDVFQTAWSKGRALSMDEAIRIAAEE